MSKIVAPLIVIGGFAVLLVGVIRWPWFGAALVVWFVLACVAVVMLNYAAGELTDRAQSIQEEAEYWQRYQAEKGKK